MHTLHRLRMVASGICYTLQAGLTRTEQTAGAIAHRCSTSSSFFSLPSTRSRPARPLPRRPRAPDVLPFGRICAIQHMSQPPTRKQLQNAARQHRQTRFERQHSKKRRRGASKRQCGTGVLTGSSNGRLRSPQATSAPSLPLSRHSRGPPLRTRRRSCRCQFPRPACSCPERG